MVTQIAESGFIRMEDKNIPPRDEPWIWALFHNILGSGKKITPGSQKSNCLRSRILKFP